MAEEGSVEDQPITFHIKTAGDTKFSVTVPLTMTVQSLKELLSSDNYAKIAPERQRLIYSGRVLKDPDTLATYKIKENNTLHLVKAAESNVRNQPGNQGASTVSGSAGGAAASSQLPNMATGTGANNLLAGLTGARYAGHAQLPNQSMFGPDGGMGPPPDDEERIRQLEDPAVRQQISEALNNPAVLDEMIRQNPMLRDIPNVRQMLQNPMVRQMMTDPQVIRQQMQMMRAMGQGQGQQSNFAAPGGVEGGEGQGQNQQAGGQGGTTSPPPNPFAMFGQPGAGGMAGNPLAALLGGQPPAAGEGGDANRGNSATPAAQNPFGSPFGDNPMMQNMARNLMQNPELMQQMTQAMFAPAGGETGGNTQQQNRPGGDAAAAGQTGQPSAAANPFAALLGGAGGANPFAGGANPFAGFDAFQGTFGAPPAGPPDTRPPEERYADQLRQLNDMGFYEFERNIEALRRSGGSVQGAVNHLLGG